MDPRFDPAQPDPADIANVPITVPLATTPGGQAYVGQPSNPDPNAAQEAAQAQFNAGQGAAASLAAWQAAHPGLAGGGNALATPVAAPAAAPPGLIPLPDAVPAAASTAATTAPAATPARTGGTTTPRPAATATATSDPFQDPAVKAADRRILDSDIVDNAIQGEQLQADQATLEKTARDQAAGEVQRKIAEQHAARTEAEQRVQTLRQKAASAPYHSFWQDKSAGQAILAGLSILAGGVSWDPHHQNQAVSIIDNAIKQDFQKQEAQHAQLWKNVETAIQQGQQLSSDQLREMGDFRALQALKLDAAISKGKELIAANKAHGETLAMKDQLSRMEFAREQAYDESTRLHQSAAEVARHNRAEEGIQAARERREAATAGDAKQEQQLIKVTQLVNGTLKDKATPELIKQIEEMRAAKSAVESGNAISKGAALDLFTKAVTGLGARPQAVAMFEKRAGGTVEQLKSIFTKGASGDPLTPNETKRFLGAINVALDEKLARKAEMKKQHGEALSRNPVLAKHKDILSAALDNVYGPDEVPAAAAPAAAPQIREGQTATGPGGKRIVFKGGQWQALQ